MKRRAILIVCVLLVWVAPLERAGADSLSDLRANQAAELAGAEARLRAAAAQPGADVPRLIEAYKHECGGIRQKYQALDPRPAEIQRAVESSGGQIENTGSKAGPADVRAGRRSRGQNPGSRRCHRQRVALPLWPGRRRRDALQDRQQGHRHDPVETRNRGGAGRQTRGPRCVCHARRPGSHGQPGPGARRSRLQAGQPAQGHRGRSQGRFAHPGKKRRQGHGKLRGEGPQRAGPGGAQPGHARRERDLLAAGQGSAHL